MPRKKIPEQSEYPWHITVRCNNRDWFSIGKEKAWEIISDQLYFVSHGFGVKILAFVLMDNHYHSLLTTPFCNLGKAMNWFNRETAKEINGLSNSVDHLWGGRYFKSMITSPHYFLHALKYVYANPIKANLCQNLLDYKYSSLPGLLGLQKLEFPIYDNTIFDMGVENFISWLSKTPDKTNWELVTQSLKKSTMKLPKLNRYRNDSILEYSMF